jgi:sugar/nucleoside kinase (ribokinase family)
MKGITALTQPLIDIIAPVTVDFLHVHNLAPESSELTTEAQQNFLLEKMSPSRISTSVGGSALNSMITAQALGIPTSIHGAIGDDKHAEQLLRELRIRGIRTILSPNRNGQTGTCLSMITPDGARTMRTNLEHSRTLDKTHISKQAIEDSTWLFIEGYLLCSGENNTSAALESIRIAREHKTKIALSLSAERIARQKRQNLLSDILPLVDIVFANSSEALALTEEPSAPKALQVLRKLCRGVIITCGELGSIGYLDGSTWSTEAFRTNKPIVDTTGAGDIYAGAFLAGLLRQQSPQWASLGAAKLSSVIITQRGTLLPKAAIADWLKALKT